MFPVHGANVGDASWPTGWPTITSNQLRRPSMRSQGYVRYRRPVGSVYRFIHGHSLYTDPVGASIVASTIARYIPGINPHYCDGGGGEFPPDRFFTAISKPLGVSRNALVTFPKYDGATKWHIFRNSIPNRQSIMAAAKPVINIFPFINNIEQ